MSGVQPPMQIHMTDFCCLKIWRMATILKTIKCNISATVGYTLMKYGMVIYIAPSKSVGYQKNEYFENKR